MLTIGNVQNRVTGGVRLPIAMMVLLALVAGVVAAQNLTQLDFPVKMAVVAAFAIVATALVTYRPIVFPFALYLFLVPFDGVLQTGSGTITKFLASASMAVILLAMLDRRRLVAPPLVVGLWGLYLAWNVASLAWSDDPWFHIDRLETTAQLFALLTLFAVVRVRWNDMRILLGTVVAGAVACAGYGVYLLQTGSLSTNATSARLDFSISDTQGINADHFSASLVLPIAIATVAALRLHGWRKAIAATSALILVIGVCASGTRGSIFAIGAMWLFLLIAYRHRVQLLIVAGVGLAASFAVPNVWQRFTDPSQGEAGGRYGIWAIAWDAFRHHWLLGVGTEQFRLAYEESYLRVAHGLMIHPWMEDSHNMIASTGVELGIIGLAILLACWYAQFRVGSAIPATSPMYDARIAVQAGTIGLFVDAMTLDILFYKYLWLAFMMAVMVRNAWVTEQTARAATLPAMTLTNTTPPKISAPPRARVVDAAGSA